MDFTKAQALATEFLVSGQGSDQISINVPGSALPVVITIGRASAEPVKKAMIKLSEGWTVSPYGSGQICGACSGTGRL